jgi:hypothetical protein
MSVSAKGGRGFNHWSRQRRNRAWGAHAYPQIPDIFFALRGRGGGEASNKTKIEEATR